MTLIIFLHQFSISINNKVIIKFCHSCTICETFNAAHGTICSNFINNHLNNLNPKFDIFYIFTQQIKKSFNGNYNCDLYLWYIIIGPVRFHHMYFLRIFKCVLSYFYLQQGALTLLGPIATPLGHSLYLIQPKINMKILKKNT